METVKIIGMGLTPEDLTGERLKIIAEADILVGGKRLLDYFGHIPALKKEIDKKLTVVIDYIREHMASKSIVVLASGDPLYFGIGARLVRALGPENVIIYPNISAVAAGFARIKEPWNDVRVISLHGRDNKAALSRALETEAMVAVFTDPKNTPARIARWLLEEDAGHFRLCVLESLGTRAERVAWYTPDEADGMQFCEPNLVILKREPGDLPEPLHLGMPDYCYQHQKGLITKSEIRAVSLAKLRLLKHHVVWDLGAGSGSVSIEACLLVPEGKVFAVEENPQRIQQIEINKNRFNANNLEIVRATLPQGLEDLPRPDRIFIGGGGRDLAAIIDAAARFLKSGGRVVINTVLLQNVTEAAERLKALGFKTATVQVQVSRSRVMPWGNRMEAYNPVWIISGII